MYDQSFSGRYTQGALQALQDDTYSLSSVPEQLLHDCGGSGAQEYHQSAMTVWRCSAQAVLAVVTSAARAMSEQDQAECRLVTQSLPLVAACLTAHYKELPASALSCLDALLGEPLHSQAILLSE
jgi:hypothetical protein